MNGRSGLHLNPKSTLITCLKSRMSFGNDTSVNEEYKMCYGCGTTVSTKHYCDNIVHKACLNGLSSYDYLSGPFS